MDFNDYEYYGVRVTDGENIAVGDELDQSRIWVDGEPTDEYLDGTCAIEVIDGNVSAAIETAKIYALAALYYLWPERNDD